MPDANEVPNIEVVEMLSPGAATLARWNPAVGLETEALLDHIGLPPDSRLQLQTEAVGVLSKGTPPTAHPERETGLVVGYVQSGKTMSFTTVAALARDNNYPLVIIIAGTSRPLSMQSMTRLQKDLRLLTRPDRKWLHLHNPSVRRQDTPRMSGVLADWQDEDVADNEKQTILVTVMKNHKHLNNLAAVLDGLDLQGVPTLIIDDEADQAGLNNQVQEGTQSTTYSQLMRLRHKLPHHTFYQYTATPQAPLLIALIDALSPRFADVLTPGAEYVGGRDFFTPNSPYICQISADEIPTRAHPLTEPPASLLNAMRTFYIGVAAGLILDENSGNRSMMVHPSQETMRHAEYYQWVRAAKEQWESLLGYDEQDQDRQDLLADFEESYNDLRTTALSIPAFQEISRSLRRAIRRTQVTEINAARGATPNIDWRAAYANILVGGQAMDRGFTVEGLTVTYMPRSIGVGNADTIQQRARFFGYKRSYLGYCRVFLEATAARIYQQYVAHEEDVRDRLVAHGGTGQPLTEWKRAFILNRALRPTRDSVLSLDYMQDRFRNSWYTPRAPHDSEDAIITNRRIVQGFTAGLQFAPDQGHPQRTEAQRHLVAADVSVSSILENLLVSLRMTYSPDSQRLTGVMIQIQKHLESHPDTLGSVYLMSGGQSRVRAANTANEIPTLFQGANFAGDGNVTTYPGDREIREADRLTVQIHNLDVTTSEGTITNVPAVAVWVPTVMSNDWYVQEGTQQV